MSSQTEQTTSTFHLVEQLFQNHLTKLQQSDAIPDGHPISKDPADDELRLRVKDVVGIDLPSAPITSILVDAYLQANHWYLTLFHEQSFRARLAPIIQTGRISASEKPFLMLILIVLMIGARFVCPESIGPHDTLFDSTLYSSQLLEAVEKHLFIALHDVTLESVSCALLMSITYLLERKTKLAFIMTGIGVRVAQAIGLQDETTREPLDHIELQVRRRVWWSIYMADMYTAQAYGKPSVFAGSRFQVSEPGDLDDTLIACPGMGSFEVREDGTFSRVTIFSYNRYKSPLYSIMSLNTQRMRLQQINSVYARLLEWEKTLPRELRLDSFSSTENELHQNGALRIFALQAITLQLTYDYNHLLLFRPFLLNKKHLSIQLHPHPAEAQNGIPITVRDQLSASAIRMSKVYEWRTILVLASRTTCAAQVCFQFFTAGVVLAMLALSDLSSPQLVEYKQALARLINILPLIGGGTPLSNQSVEILTDAMHIISSQEVKALISNATNDFRTDRSSPAIAGASRVQATQTNMQSSTLDSASQSEVMDDTDMWEDLTLFPDDHEVDIAGSESFYQSLALLF